MKTFALRRALLTAVTMTSLLLIIFAVQNNLKHAKSTPEASSSNQQPEPSTYKEVFTGFIRNVDAGKETTTVEIDDVEVAQSDEDPGFTFENISSTTEMYSLTDSTEIHIFAHPGSPDLKQVSLLEFVSAAQKKESFITSSPFNVIVQGSTIIQLEQQYTP